MERPARPTFAGFRISALAEILLMLAVLLAGDALLFHTQRYWDVNPHPFWFIVLLTACKYGVKEGLLAAVACTLALLVGNMPQQQIDQDSYAYLFNVSIIPLLWMVSAVTFGIMREMHIGERNRLEREVEEAAGRENRIAQSYQWVKDLKERLELRVAGQIRSSIAAYRAARAMEASTQAEVLQGMEDLVAATLHPEQFSIYLLSGRTLEARLTHSWKEKDTYVRRFDANSPIYQALISSGGVLCVTNHDHEQMLAGQAILAGALTDRDTGEALGMLKIEKLGFTDLNLSAIETFAAICDWAGMALAGARKYEAAKSQSMVNPDHNLLSYSYFRRYADTMAALGKRVGFHVTMIVVRLVNPEQLPRDARAKVARQLSESVNAVLRNVDQAFDYQKNNEEYSIVLPATDVKGAQVVLDKIRADLLRRAGQAAADAEFSFSIQAIYEKQ